ncbi:unnamed protein product [Somion occarium]|uniref:Uncharacterized protein n=1 Tax=Somion occarium TaxID=3059160 RepID=A0ABP1EB76_9APHY
MFKRVEKRRRKQAKEEDLGLTGEMKEVLGMHDTDSEESDSSAEGSSSESESEGEDIVSQPMPQNAASESDEMDEEGTGSAEEDEESEEEDESSHESPPISVTEAMKDPVYIISLDPDVRACAVCQGKLLKNSTMAEVHKASKAHYRRFSRFVEFAGTADPDTDLSEFWQMLNAANKPKERTKESSLSKRAAKRKAKLASIKAKREKAKEMKAKGLKFKAEKKAKKLAATPAAPGASSGDGTKAAESDLAQSTASSKPPKKKRKLDSTSNDVKSNKHSGKKGKLREALKADTSEQPKSSTAPSKSNKSPRKPITSTEKTVDKFTPATASKAKTNQKQKAGSGPKPSAPGRTYKKAPTKKAAVAAAAS